MRQEAIGKMLLIFVYFFFGICWFFFWCDSRLNHKRSKTPRWLKVANDGWNRMQSWDTIKGYWNTICRILLHWHLRDCKGRVPRKHIVAVARAENLSDLGQWFFGSSLFYTGSAKTLQSHPFLVLPKSSFSRLHILFLFVRSCQVIMVSECNESSFILFQSNLTLLKCPPFVTQQLQQSRR